MCKLGINFLQLYFSLPRVGGKVNSIKTVKDITNFISLNLIKHTSFNVAYDFIS